MFNTILRTLWTLIAAALDKDPEIRRSSAFAGACFLASIGASVGTAWLSQPIYHSMFNSPEPFVSWSFSAFIGWLMLAGTTVIGFYAAEKISNEEPLLDYKQVGVVALVVLCVGTFDALKNYEGASERSYEAFTVQAYTEAQKGGEKPYEREIKAIEDRVALLYSEGQKVMYRGRLTTPYKNILIAEKLEKQKAEYQALQITALEEERALHNTNNERKLSMRDDTEQTLKGLSIFLYIIQIVLAVPLGIFSVKWDMRDGVRDGRYTPKQETRSGGAGDISYRPATAYGQNKIGFETSGSRSAPGQNMDSIKDELQAIRFMLGTLSPKGINTPINTGINSPNEPEEDLESLVFSEEAPSPDMAENIFFLRKYREVVRAILEGYSYARIRSETGVSKTTAQNVKRTMRAVQMIK